MPELPLSAISIRRRALGLRMFCCNALLWGLGNGLVSTSLIVYLVGALAAGRLEKAQIGLAIGWIIAAPRLIGVLRIFTLSLIDLFESRKPVAFTAYLFSPMVLLALPLGLSSLSALAERHVNAALLTVGTIWAIYHVIEYFGTVALWGWLGDSLQARIRPLFLARRERWMIAGQFVGALVSGLWSFFLYERLRADGELWRLYLVPTLGGITFLIASAFPILWIPDVRWVKADSIAERLTRLVRPLRSRRFLAFLCFGCALQIAGGLGQSVQSFTQMKTLGVPLLVTLALGSWTRIGQMILAGRIGGAIRKFGHRPIAVISLGVVSTGTLFYAWAIETSAWLIVGAATVWIGWIGVNLVIADLTIRLAPGEDCSHGVQPVPSQKASDQRERNSLTARERKTDGTAHSSGAIAVMFTATTLAFGASSLVGGHLFDLLRESVVAIPLIERTVTFPVAMFLLVALLRAATILFWIKRWK